jgi:MFS transporter, PAT family, beta-lactamase induction signal transducer AmpG
MGSTLDCALEAYRIESTPSQSQKIASGYNVFGWRLGAWMTGSASLFIAHYRCWDNVFDFLFYLSLVNTVVIFFMKPIRHPQNQDHKKSVRTSFWQAFLSLQKELHLKSLTIFIMAYKATDAFIRQMLPCYFTKLSCSKGDIAYWDKSVGFIATLAGIFLFSFFMHKRNIAQGFWLWFWIKFLAISLFYVHSLFFLGHSDLNSKIFLNFANILAHFAGGIGQATLIAYYALLCKKIPNHTMICYAILSSIGSLGRFLFSMISGFFSSFLPWPYFFFVCLCLCAPFFLFMIQKNPFSLAKTKGCPD